MRLRSNAFGGVIVFGLSRSLVRPQYAGAEGLVGELGTVETEISERGRILVRGELWTAAADENLPSGARVKIVGFDGLTVRVTRVSDETEGS